MPAYDRVITGMPAWLMRKYLGDLGAGPAVDGWQRGAGWAAHVEEVEDFTVGSLRVGQVRLRIEASEEVMARLLPELEKKLLRGGG